MPMDPNFAASHALMDEMFATVSYVEDYAGQPLPDVEDEDDDGDPIVTASPE